MEIFLNTYEYKPAFPAETAMPDITAHDVDPDDLMVWPCFLLMRENDRYVPLDGPTYLTRRRSQNN